MGFRETELVLFTADLAGYARATAQLPALEIAAYLEGWYREIDAAIGGRGGRVVKYMGDGCLATFPADGAGAAIEAAGALLVYRSPGGLELSVGVRIHIGTVAEGEVGGDRRHDIFGSAVNDLFRMGGAGSVLISEALYQRLPEDQRGRWRRHPMPAVYALVR
ncbi:MAG TPA: adenylate/guanylate cyclase domain-containing protein [Kofleriaceae bacterium]|jgi:adenylate cyclase|nr:adenylate/guanylate cyclase domain-containing protein [Kofleriaceae bacterium]